MRMIKNVNNDVVPRYNDMTIDHELCELSLLIATTSSFFIVYESWLHPGIKDNLSSLLGLTFSVATG